MFRVVLKQARPGMTLARTLTDPHRPDAALLARGDVLSPDVIAFLHEEGIYDLWIQDAGLNVLEDLIAPSLDRERQRLGETIIQGFHTAGQRAAPGFCTAHMRETLRGALQMLLTSNLPCVKELAGADEHIVRHGAEVCYTALLLGARLQEYVMEQRRHVGIHAREMVTLALGCLFHDLGETLLDDKDREQRRVESGTSTAWQRHAELGFNLVRGQLDPSAAAVVLHHHQHFDGTGFPALAGKEPQTGERIHVFSRIAMVADTFTHFLKHDGVPMPSVHALWRLQHPTCRGWCDPVVLGALMETVTPYLPGMVVQLSDRRFAVVTGTNAATPCYPEVQTLSTMTLRHDEEPMPRERIDLATRGDLWVQTVDGIDVTPFSYGAAKKPTLAALAETRMAIAV